LTSSAVVLFFLATFFAFWSSVDTSVFDLTLLTPRLPPTAFLRLGLSFSDSVKEENDSSSLRNESFGVVRYDAARSRDADRLAFAALLNIRNIS
jgi:hypothetical protein